jgi:ribose-phosphate pyrophosphokinase
MHFILTSLNEQKMNTLNNILKKVYQKYSFVGMETSDESTINQPINNTLECAKKRVQNALNKAEKSENSDNIYVSIENGLELNNGSWFDVCYLYVINLKESSEVFYKSFGIKLHDRLINAYFESKTKLTYGEFLDLHFKVNPKNWMSDVRFGNVDRQEQIENVIVQWIIDVNTKIYKDYPKSGIMFKDVCSLLEKPALLSLLVDQCIKHINVKHDIDEVDYIVGLQSRGYLLGTIIAEKLNKGFIAMRKLDKVPTKENVVTEDFKTEYSDDTFAMIKDPNYEGKKCLIIDDLAATGGSFIAAANVAIKVGLKVVGFLATYDVEPLRITCRSKVNPDMTSIIVRTNDNLIPYYHQPTTDMTLEHKPLTYVKDWEINLNPEKCAIISCNGSRTLTEKIARHLNLPICNTTSNLFNNGEVNVIINENVRNKHVIIVCSTRTGHINDDFMELVMLQDACYRTGVDKVTLIVPYFPYARSDKKDKSRVPIGGKAIANILAKVDNIVSLDLHAGQEQGFTDRGFHNLYVVNYMAQFLVNNFFAADMSKYVLVSPDAGSIKRIEEYAELLKMNYIILHKHRDYNNPGTVKSSDIIAKESFEGKIGVLIDDMADTCGTMMAAADELVKNGIEKVIIAVSHGVLSSDAVKKIKKNDRVMAVIATNSLPQSDNIKKCNKIIELDVSKLFACAIDGIITGKSVSELFNTKKK